MVTQEDVPVGQVLPGKGMNSLVRGSRTSGVFRLPFTTQHQVTPTQYSPCRLSASEPQGPPGPETAEPAR